MPSPPAPLDVAPSAGTKSTGTKSVDVGQKDITPNNPSTDNGDAQPTDSATDCKPQVKKWLCIAGVGLAVAAVIIQGGSSCEVEEEKPVVVVEEKEPEEEKVEWWQNVKTWILGILGKKDEKVASVYQFEQGHSM